MNSYNFAREFNKIFSVLNKEESYFSGSKFISVVRENDPFFPDYTQYINTRKSENKSTSRKDYFYDILLNMSTNDRIALMTRLYELADEMASNYKPPNEDLLKTSMIAYEPKIPIDITVTSNIMASTVRNPKVFISYAWENDDLKQWVKQLAIDLRKNGIDVKLDQWEVVPGDQMPHFMETSVRSNDYVLLVCTPKYKDKSEGRVGGVGYEGDIMTGEVLQTSNHRKFIPVLHSGDKNVSIPAWLAGKYFVDLSNSEHYDTNFEDLLATILNARETAPLLGEIPDRFRKDFSQSTIHKKEEDIILKIKGIIVDEVTQPINDGSRGSGLYKIPFELTRRPPSEWISLFVDAFDRPMEFTSMHRPGIASVIGNKIFLDGTTIEEVERYHKKTLKMAVNTANQKYAEIIESRRQAEELETLQKKEHKRNLDEISRRISFDD